MPAKLKTTHPCECNRLKTEAHEKPKSFWVENKIRRLFAGGIALLL
jgi:hypothetical protein